MSKKRKLRTRDYVTAEVYHHIKAEICLGKSDKRIMRQYEISNTAINNIRNTANYYEFRLRTDPRLKKTAHKPIVVIAEKSGLPFEDYRPRGVVFYSPKPLKSKNDELSNKIDEEAERISSMLGMIMASIILIVLLVIVVALVALFGGV